MTNPLLPTILAVSASRKPLLGKTWGVTTYSSPKPPSVEPGWYPDPLDHRWVRWHDGLSWTPTTAAPGGKKVSFMPPMAINQPAQPAPASTLTTADVRDYDADAGAMGPDALPYATAGVQLSSYVWMVFGLITQAALVLPIVAIVYGVTRRLSLLTELTGAAGSSSRRVSQEQLTLFATTDATASMSLGVAMALAGVVFIAWLFLAHLSVRQSPWVRSSSAWAIFGWFIPILSFVKPYRVTQEAYVGALPGHERHGDSLLVMAWWMFALLSVGGQVFVAFSAFDLAAGATVADLARVVRISIGLSLINVVGAGLAIAVVGQITGLLRRR